MTIAPGPSDGDNAILRFFGGLLIVAGGSLIVLSGTCSVAVLGNSIGNQFVDAIPLVLIFGGIPMVVGFGLFALGRWMRPKRQ